MKKRKQSNEPNGPPAESAIEEIRQLIKKQELQTTILKKLIEKSKETK